MSIIKAGIDSATGDALSSNILNAFTYIETYRLSDLKKRILGQMCSVACTILLLGNFGWNNAERWKSSTIQQAIGHI